MIIPALIDFWLSGNYRNLVGNEIPFDLWIKRKLDAPDESSLKILLALFDSRTRGDSRHVT